ncbi:MAG TPA: hypothetical protein VGE74_07695 [Gemmata sp.]
MDSESDTPDEQTRRIERAGPKLLKELEETAAWLDGRAKELRNLLKHVKAERKQDVRDEAARFEGRAALIRVTVARAKHGT